MAASSTPSASSTSTPLRVFVSGQQTATLASVVRALHQAGRPLDIKASTPPFNLRKDPSWDGISYLPVNAKSFGVKIPHAVKQLIETPTFKAWWLKDPRAAPMIPKLLCERMDDEVQAKASRILTI